MSEDLPRYAQRLLARIERRTASIGVVGLGYVGLPLAAGLARAGFSVTGIDIDTRRVQMCQHGQSWIADVPSQDLSALTGSNRLCATTDITDLEELDAIAICVPTPLNEAKEPHLDAVMDVVDAIAGHLHPGLLIILESTTYPGTTDECILPRLQRTGMSVGVDFFLAYSPERIDPGNTRHGLLNTPKVISGITPACLHLSRALYESIVDTVVPVSSTRTAELVKLFENIFRAVNIGLVNELAIMANVLNVDAWEVIAAAATKPYGFTPFYPGPGVGGHCIPIDPYYLSWKLRMHDYSSRLIEAANEINERMPLFVVERISNALHEAGLCLDQARILILGIAYKRDVADVRESPAISIIELLHARGAHVKYVDPYIPELTLQGVTLASVPIDSAHLRDADCVVIVTDHSIFDYASIASTASLLVDTRNATAGMTGAHIRRL